MSYIEVTAGYTLNGEIMVQGSKNSALPIIAASLLNNGTTVIKNCPRITDINDTLDVIESMGCVVKRFDRTVIIDSTNMSTSNVTDAAIQNTRASMMLLGALIGRFRKTEVLYPGGCAIGQRSIDIHIECLRKMNVDIIENEKTLLCETAHLTGNIIRMSFPSVGATENCILAAVLADGITEIHNAACEPEIVYLCKFLCGAGADIKGYGSKIIRITGVAKLHDSETSLPADRIVAGTYMTAAAAAGGQVIVRGPKNWEINKIVSMLRRMGCIIKSYEDAVIIENYKRLSSPVEITTAPFPEFPTDMQSQFMALAATADGTCVINENIFESRFLIVPDLLNMGADISTNKNVAVINGVERIKGCECRIMDLRGGAALVIAGLSAEGTTVLYNTQYIERGYENIAGDLHLLGADIKYISEQNDARRMIG